MTSDINDLKRGGCHCGAVAFEVRAKLERGSICNCSICTKKGFVHWIVPAEAFALLRGRESLSTYRFNTGAAEHLFCKVCGICSFYVPRSHPDGFSINLRCVEGVDFAALPLRTFDGKNWERARSTLEE